MKQMQIMRIILTLVMALGFSLGNLTAGLGAEAIKLPPPATKGSEGRPVGTVPVAGGRMEI
jgi:hypothetical protein